MDCKPVDLSVVLKEFNSWDQHLGNYMQKNKVIEHQLDIAKREIEDAKERETYLMKELKTSRDLLSAIQTTVTTQCDLEDDNVRLQGEKEELTEKLNVTIKKNQSRVVSLEETIADLKKEHEEKISEVKSSLLHSATEEKMKLRRILDEKISHISRLEKQLSDLENEKQSELMKLRLEYDSKLLVLQKQTTKVQQTTSQISASNQDIFRKKLQHVKAESEREISNLKRTITELQSKVNSQGQRSTNQASALSLAKKKKVPTATLR